MIDRLDSAKLQSSHRWPAGPDPRLLSSPHEVYLLRCTHLAYGASPCVSQCCSSCCLPRRPRAPNRSSGRSAGRTGVTWSSPSPAITMPTPRHSPPGRWFSTWERAMPDRIGPSSSPVLTTRGRPPPGSRGSVRFQLPEQPRGVYALRIEFADVHHLRPPLFMVAIGDRSGSFQLSPGGGDASLTDPRAGKPQKLELVLPASCFKQGANEIRLTSPKARGSSTTRSRCWPTRKVHCRRQAFKV